MQQIYMTGAFKGFKRAWNTITIDDLSQKQKREIERRLKIISFFDQYGESATKQAFDVSRSTVYLWKKKLKDSKGKLISLSSKSKRPKRFRRSQVDRKIKDFILNYRLTHPGVGKVAIHYALKKYCLKSDLEPVSESTVGRIISKLKKQGKLSDNLTKLRISGSTGKLLDKTKRKRRKKNRRKGYLPQEPGDLIQIDSVTIFLEGIKRYLITAIDVKGKFAFAYAYNSLSSRSGADFFKKLEQVSPYQIKRIQTDNGLEFEKCFRDYVEKKDIIHYHNYPGKPQSNSCVERFNRTIQEQYVNRNKGGLHNVDKFNKGLMEYLLWYNTEKAHDTLNKQPPLEYLANLINQRANLSNMLWTPTLTCFIRFTMVTSGLEYLNDFLYLS
jgi:putative transposase